MAVAETIANSKHDQALELLSYGLALIPVAWPVRGGCGCGKPDCKASGKHPLIPDWPNQWTQDINQVDKWLKRWPNLNLGIVTGFASSVVVLDIDGPEGEESLRQLEEKRGPLPETWEAVTGGGGRHIYFSCPANVSELKNAVKFLPGLDIRANGGQVLAPGSLHYTGAYYEWELLHHPEEVELAGMPDWLFTIIRDFCKQDAGKKYPEDGPIPEGQRNDYLAHFAGKLRRTGCSEPVLLAALQVENENRCRPPLPDSELKQIAKSISRYPPGENHSTPEEDFADSFNDGEPWPDPQLLGEKALLEVMKLTPEFMPVVFRSWLLNTAYRMQCPVDFLAAGVLVAASSLIGTGCSIRPKVNDNWEVVPNLWGGIVAGPGMLKTPALKEVLKPLEKLESEAKKQYDAALEFNEADEIVYKAEKDAIKTQIAALSKGKEKKTDGRDKRASTRKA